MRYGPALTTFLCGLALAACDGDPDECATFEGCAAGEVCVFSSEPVTGEPLPDTACLPSSVCQTRDDIRAGSALHTCIKDTASCAGDTSLKVCDNQARSGCYKPAFDDTACPTDMACIGPDHDAVCEATCSSDGACSGQDVCMMSAGSGALFCGPVGSGPTADTLCTLTLESAVLPERNGNATWDFSGLPDPIATVRYASGARWRTVALQETLTPAWNASAPEVTFAEIAGMRIDIVDEDDPIEFGFEVSNEDDFAAAYLPDGGRWFMDGQLTIRMTQEFISANFPDAPTTLTLAITCQ
ncbi:MAG: hypothetical protein ACI9MR_002564 [Myxococcota bacterium]|jgi:hypothetical protein